MADEVQKHLDNARYGTKLNPDEQRQYLGTFRERVYLTLTESEMTQKFYHQAILTEVAKHPTAFLLIKGSLNETLQAIYVTLASANKLRFTIVSDPEFTDHSDFGAILADKVAVDEEVIDVKDKYPLPEAPATPEEKPKSEGFFKKLFR